MGASASLSPRRRCLEAWRRLSRAHVENLSHRSSPEHVLLVALSSIKEGAERVMTGVGTRLLSESHTWKKKTGSNFCVVFLGDILCFFCVIGGGRLDL